MLKPVLVILFMVACGYRLMATLLASGFARRRVKVHPGARYCLVKPLKASRPESRDAIDSFREVIASRSADFYICSPEAAPKAWLDERPDLTWLKTTRKQDVNGKASCLAQAQKYFSGDFFIVSDSDMSCKENYLPAVLGEFSSAKIGLVTSLYRGEMGCFSWGGLLECLFMLDFAESVLVAERVEGLSFAMGSTMAVRRSALESIGGFQSLEPYLADDYQLGYQIHRLGWKLALAPTVMGTLVPSSDIRAALRHQYRWMVTSRLSRPGGHLAFLLTQGLLWALVLLIVSPALGIQCLLSWIGMRVFLAYWNDLALLGPKARGLGWGLLLYPLKDLLFLPLWGAALVEDKVHWGDEVMSLDRQGKIIKIS